MPTVIDPDAETTESDRRQGAAPPAGTPSSAELRRRIRRLRLHGATTYACRHCRTPVRVVSAAYLPESCSACGRGTWTSEGRDDPRMLVALIEFPSTEPAQAFAMSTERLGPSQTGASSGGRTSSSRSSIRSRPSRPHDAEESKGRDPPGP